jgi:hypothetical protein
MRQNGAKVQPSWRSDVPYSTAKIDPMPRRSFRAERALPTTASVGQMDDHPLEALDRCGMPPTPSNGPSDAVSNLISA